ncbi:LacI family DNA-binding transcriptional regulator [Vibrio owensii]|uniref:LacI family DNA-binding transcriptional regulator n=1 Tax=Vibrio owensii TaxID=696485 RepID=UPI0018F2275E|nr:LacI family DNA-binding transcriptional regulator [Vibrio owensii]
MAVTLKDIAKVAGVSTVTVSYVLNNKNRVGEATKAKVMKAAKSLNYVPNRAAKMLASKSTKHICLIISGPDYEYLTNPYIYKLVNGICASLGQLGYEMTLRMTKADNELTFIQGELNSNLYDGALVWGTRMPDEQFLSLFNHRVPIVSIARDLPDEIVNAVLVEHYQSSYQMTKYLIDSGYKKIMFLGRLDGIKAARDRFEGYRQALLDNGIEYDESWAYKADYYQEDAYQIICNMEAIGFDAIFAASDLMAIGAMKALLEKGLVIPTDIAVAGFDNIPNSDMLPVGLTTVDTPIFQLGSQAATMLVKLIEEQETNHKIELSTKLIIRQST